MVAELLWFFYHGAPLKWHWKVILWARFRATLTWRCQVTGVKSWHKRSWSRMADKWVLSHLRWPPALLITFVLLQMCTTYCFPPAFTIAAILSVSSIRHPKLVWEMQVCFQDTPGCFFFNVDFIRFSNCSADAIVSTGLNFAQSFSISFHANTLGQSFIFVESISIIIASVSQCITVNRFIATRFAFLFKMTWNSLGFFYPMELNHLLAAYP